MSKITKEDKKLIENKFTYIGLNLDKLPKFLTEFEPLNFRPVKSYNNSIYKVYKHINVQDIEILITPTDRLTDLKERYKLATPIFTYLDDKSEENVEKFATFLKMLTDLDIDKIENIQKEQEELKNKMPTKVKYTNHFIWQIYYSDYAHKYFMLVPTKEQDTSALFYLLKKQINSKKSRKKETVFVPISHLDYSGEFLTKSEITDLENYLWFFTKEWPSIYEVYDIKNKMSIKIIGETNVYEKIKSEYYITLSSKEEAVHLYKLLKAMFILSTGAQSEYKFKAQISEKGNLQFVHKEKEMTYENLADYIKTEYLDKIDKLKKEIKETGKLKKRLKRFNNIVEELTQEYLSRQRQIATFLECKKTFFGRVKYFFKKKKDVQIVKKPEKIERDELSADKEVQNIYEEKEQYTIEDLINICAKLVEVKKENKNINLDIYAIENKKDILRKKIDNADLYIKEIDKHKKSIFEFWKYTSKDEIQTLNEGEEEKEDKREKIEKYFDYEKELEDLGKIVDELQRRKLSKNETDSIFAAKHTIESFRELYNSRKSNETSEVNIKVLEKDLKKLKKEYKDNIEYINMKDFDIFGSLSEDITKIKEINNQKHREIAKDKYKVLGINLETKVETYRDNLRYYLNLISEAFNKIQSPYNMSVYKVNNKKEIEGIEIFDINPSNALKSERQMEKESIIMCRLNIKENMPIVYYSNIIFYDNFNKTLPIGMDLSTEVLVDLNKIKITCIKEEEFYINYSIDEYEKTTQKVKVYEYYTDYI